MWGLGWVLQIQIITVQVGVRNRMGGGYRYRFLRSRYGGQSLRHLAQGCLQVGHKWSNTLLSDWEFNKCNKTGWTGPQHTTTHNHNLLSGTYDLICLNCKLCVENLRVDEISCKWMGSSCSPCTCCSIASTLHHKPCPAMRKYKLIKHWKTKTKNNHITISYDSRDWLTRTSSSWYSIVGGFPSLLGFSTIGFFTIWDTDANKSKSGLEEYTAQLNKPLTIIYEYSYRLDQTLWF